MSFDESGLDHAFGFAGLGRWDYAPDTGALVLDAQCRELFNVTDVEVLTSEVIMSRLHEDDRDRVAQALGAIQSEGQVFEEVFRVPVASGVRWIRGMGRFGMHSGRPRVLGVSLDVTAEQELRLQRELHFAEMNHRIKNLFALVSAMISSAARESDAQGDLVDNLRGRVSALDRAHSLMVRTDVSQPILLSALLDSVLAPARSQQNVAMSGDDVMIPARSITSLVLIIHEWVTNSAKYGALRQSDGQISIDWTQTGDSLRMQWREMVPDYDPNAEKGFGSRLIQASALQLGAEKTRTYRDGWLTIEMKMPLGA